MATYKLSKSGIERLERFKRDIESGKARVFFESCYYAVENFESITCCFTDDEESAKADALKQIQTSLTGEIEKNEFGFVVSGGCGLGKSDVELIQNN